VEVAVAAAAEVVEAGGAAEVAAATILQLLLRDPAAEAAGEVAEPLELAAQ
jgi:hypothetical protein